MTLQEQKQLSADCIQLLHSAYENKLGGSVTVFKNSIHILITVPSDFNEFIILEYCDTFEDNRIKLNEFILLVIDNHYTI